MHSSKPSSRFQLLVDKAKNISRRFTLAVVNPINSETLKGALAAAEEKLITPLLIGPEAKINETAREIGKDIKEYQVVNVAGDLEAAYKAVALVNEGKADAIMKGDIHTDEIMKVFLARESGLRTSRRVSHCLLMDIPTYEKLAIFADVAINIAPDLMTKRDIIQSAIDFAAALGIKNPNVALLAATEAVLDNFPATLDAAILCKMADRGQITGGIVDGPLSIDLAISDEAIALKRFKRILTDKPDIFIAPDLNSGNIGIKILDYMAGALSAGVVVGAKVPMTLMRRSSPAVEHIISCALAKIYFNHCHKES